LQGLSDGFFFTIVVALAAIILLLIMAIVKANRCDHRFPYKEVIDLNFDPKCSKCKKYLAAIDPKQKKRFERFNDDEFKLVRR